MSYFPSLFSLAGLKHMQKAAHREASACIPSDIQFKQAIAPVKQTSEGSCTKYGTASGLTRLENQQAANLRAAAQLSLPFPTPTVGAGRTQMHRQPKKGRECRRFPTDLTSPGWQSTYERTQCSHSNLLYLNVIIDLTLLINI